MCSRDCDDEDFPEAFREAMRTGSTTVLPAYDQFAGTLVGWHYLEAIVDENEPKLHVEFRGEIVAQVNDTTFLVKEWVPTLRVSTGAASDTETKLLNLTDLRKGLYFKTGHEVEKYLSILGWVVRDIIKKREQEAKVQDK